MCFTVEAGFMCSLIPTWGQCDGSWWITETEECFSLKWNHVRSLKSLSRQTNICILFYNVCICAEFINLWIVTEVIAWHFPWAGLYDLQTSFKRQNPSHGGRTSAGLTFLYRDSERQTSLFCHVIFRRYRTHRGWQETGSQVTSCKERHGVKNVDPAGRGFMSCLNNIYTHHRRDFVMWQTFILKV